MKKPNYRDAMHYAEERLETLDERFTYHSIFHTRDDVVFAVMRYAELGDLSIDKRNLLLTAAWFHDIGYLRTRAGHEEAGVEIVKEVLPEFGFSDRQIFQISEMIMGTKVGNKPKNFLSKLLVDADLDNLGRFDFFEVSERVRQELENFDEVISTKQWWMNQIEFLKNHTYYTKEAKSLRNAKKKENMAQLQHLIAQM